MAKTIRVALPGFNASTDTDPDHFALFTEEGTDHVLIKEKTRGTEVVAGTSATIAHGLGYVPFVLVFVDQGSGKYKKAYGFSAESPNNPYYVVTATNLILRNPSGSSKTFKYYIFYDRVI